MRTLVIIAFILAAQTVPVSASTSGDTGACCLTDPPACFENFSQINCAILGGQWLGPDSSCIECDPDPIGACCFEGGNCAEVTNQYCEAISGTWLGPDTTCAQQGSQCEAADPTGACCIGPTCEVLTLPFCLTVGGDWLGEDTTCVEDQDECFAFPFLVPQEFSTIEEAIAVAEDGRESVL